MEDSNQLKELEENIDEKTVVAEERRREEKRHIPRERGQLLCPNAFQLSPSGGGGSSVTVGFRMPMGEIVCRLYSSTRVVFVEFTPSL